MATKKRLLDYILSKIEIERDGYITYVKKFGKYVFTFNNELFARVVDDTLYLRATEAGRSFLGKPVKGIPYKYAEPHFIISEEQYEDSEWFSRLVDLTLEEIVPLNPPVRRRRRRGAQMDSEE